LNDLTHPNQSALAEYIEVTLVLNPLSQGGRLVVRVAPMGTLADMITALVPDELDRDHISAFIGGDYIDPDLWAKIRPKSGASVYLRIVPQDPVTLISLLGTAAAPTITATLFPTLIAGSFGAALAGAAISMAITYAASALIGPRPTQSRTESPTYGISSARNGITPFQTVPVVLGTHRMVPPYGATPYTEVVGNAQYLRFVLIWGYGPVDVSDIRIGNTPIGDYVDVDTEHDFNGSATQLDLYPADASQEDLSIRLTTDYVERTTPRLTTEIGVTFTFPAGLFKQNDKGQRVNTSVRIIGQYRLVGAGSFTDWFDETYKDDTAKVKRVSQRQRGLTSGQYEVRVRRTVAQSNSAKISDSCIWTDLRSFNTASEPVLLSGIAKSAFRIKATGQLNGIVNQLNALVSLKIPTWNGSAWTTATSATSNPAAIFRYVLKGAPNKKPVTNANINNEELGAWYEFCEAKGFAFDQVIDFQLSVRDLLQDVANAGKASPAYVDDKWTVIIEQPRSTVIQHFTPRNTRNFAGQILYNEIPDALRIRFFNKNKGYREDEYVIYDDGFKAANATTFQMIDLPGQTNPSNVYKLGRHYIASARLRPEVFTFELDIEHLVAMRGDLCRLTHDVPGIGQMSGRVVSRATNTIVLDETVTREADKAYTLRIRETATGTTRALTVAASGTTVTSDTVTVTSGGSNVNAGDLFQFGEQNLESLEVLIAGIEYLDDLAAAVTCVPYSPAIYNAANEIPEYTTILSDPVSASFIGPPRPFISSVVSDEAALQVTSSGAIVPSIFLYVQAGKTARASDGTVTRTAFFQARFRRSGTDDPFTYMPYSAVDTPYVEIFPVESGVNYDIAVRAIGPDEATTSAFAEIANHTVIGASAKPPAVDTFTINTIGEHTYVQWTYPSIPVDVIGYEIRYSADQDNTDWKSMTTMGSSLPREARSFTVPSRSGSYAIKPIDVLQNRSVAAKYINASLEDPAAQNVVLTITENPAWGGTKTAIEVYDNKLQLQSQNFMASWVTLASVEYIGFTADTGYASEGYYEFGETDLSEVYSSRVTFNAVVGTAANLYTMSTWTTLAEAADLVNGDTGDDVFTELQINFSRTDSATPIYRGWRRFVVGDYTARHLKFRVYMNTLSPTLSPTLTSLSATIDMPDRVAKGNDIVSGAGTYSVVFSPKFRQLRSVTIAAQNMNTGDYYVISNKTRTGFDVIFRNSAGAAVSRSFDYQAIGFGRERGT
jgi:hypothetical protein